MQTVNGALAASAAVERPSMRLWIALTGISLMAGAAAVSAAEYNPARTRPAITKEGAAQRVIVKLRPTSNLQIQSARASQASVDALASSNIKRIESMAQRHGLALDGTRAISADMHVMILKSSAGASMAQTLQALRDDSAVEFAEADKWVYPHATPNDTFFSGQWFLQPPDLDERSAVNATSGWDLTTGSTGVVIAVLDTGVRFDHPDLARATQAGRLLVGHDFVSLDAPNNFFTANDGSSRDTDASDPGDWVTQSDVDAPNNQCTEVGDSSWHGTRVSGVIGALSNNNVGVAGLTWSAWISPVRVIGKCGGFNSDVLAGMRWAAGLAVPAAPTNPFPAKIINVSLGGDGPCTSQDQDVVDEVTAAGALLIVSAGNGNGQGGVEVSSPANCVGAAGIAGLRHAGTKVGFSNLGPEIAVSAPGGNCVNITGGPCVYSIDTTTNDGATTPTTSGYTDQINANVGTSFSAPIVSGIAGLMLAVNGNLRPAQLRARLREGALPFPPSNPTVPQCQPGNSTAAQLECNCTTATCGAGMANAQGAVNAALRPIAAIAIPNAFGPGTPVTLQGTGSSGSCNRTISAYQWTVVSPTSSPPTITDANLATASVNAPSGTAEYVIRLTVTDDQGRTDAADVTIRSISFTTAAPSNAGSTACPTPITIDQGSPLPNPNPPAPSPPGPTTPSSGGGGGALDLLTILFNIVVVIVAALLPRRRDRSADFAQRARPASAGAYFVQRPRMRSALSSQVFCARR
jgi:serine protease